MRWRRYGLTDGEYRTLRDATPGGCMICHGANGETDQAPAIDHDHDTQEVRGLLCSRCNLALGLFGDNVEALSRAYWYLREPPAFRLIRRRTDAEILGMVIDAAEREFQAEAARWRNSEPRSRCACGRWVKSDRKVCNECYVPPEPKPDPRSPEEKAAYLNGFSRALDEQVFGPLRAIGVNVNLPVLMPAEPRVVDTP